MADSPIGFRDNLMSLHMLWSGGVVLSILLLTGEIVINTRLPFILCRPARANAVDKKL